MWTMVKMDMPLHVCIVWSFFLMLLDGSCYFTKLIVDSVEDKLKAFLLQNNKTNGFVKFTRFSP